MRWITPYFKEPLYGDRAFLEMRLPSQRRGTSIKRLLHASVYQALLWAACQGKIDLVPHAEPGQYAGADQLWGLSDVDPTERLKVDQDTLHRVLWDTLHRILWDTLLKPTTLATNLSELLDLQGLRVDPAEFKGSKSLAQWAPQLKKRIAEAVAAVRKPSAVEALDAMIRNAKLSAVERAS